MLHRKSRSKDYDVYSDDVCGQESEDNFAKELQQYIQAKEMAKAAQALPFPEESVKKEEDKGARKGRVYLEGPHTSMSVRVGRASSCILSHDETMDLLSDVSCAA